jgi:hypothetical protein
MAVRTIVRTIGYGAYLSILVGCGVALAQEPARVSEEELLDTLDVTMVLLPEGATVPDAVTRTIELPRAAADSANPPGVDTASSARNGRERGLENAAEAREQGREFGQQMSQQAQEGRENAGRGNNGERPDLPDNVPDHAGPPTDRPGPPAN